MTGKQSAIIEVEGLNYRYPGATRSAVEGVSFDVRPGEVFGLLGPSGAGKSTIQKVLTRQHRSLSGGSVSVFGRPIGAWDQSYYEHIGVGFELPNHYLRLTARENLKFFSSLYSNPTKPIEDLLALVGLDQSADMRVSEFSKGMMMRLNFVRALMHDPQLIFLDEPTSGLDPVNARNVKRIMRKLQGEGKTIVLTTHNMSDVDELCDRVGFMVEGEMRALDRVTDLKARFGERMLRVEFDSPEGVEHRLFPLDGLGGNPDFLALLDTREVRTIHSQEASLDEVFSRVTGASLEAGQ